MRPQIDREVDMTRFIQQQDVRKEPKPEKPLPKFGGKDGNKDYSSLADAKKIISPHGGRR